jgi:hypothetical protein
VNIGASLLRCSILRIQPLLNLNLTPSSGSTPSHTLKNFLSVVSNWIVLTQHSITEQHLLGRVLHLILSISPTAPSGKRFVAPTGPSFFSGRYSHPACSVARAVRDTPPSHHLWTLQRLPPFCDLVLTESPSPGIHEVNPRPAITRSFPRLPRNMAQTMVCGRQRSLLCLLPQELVVAIARSATLGAHNNLSRTCR